MYLSIILTKRGVTSVHILPNNVRGVIAVRVSSISNAPAAGTVDTRGLASSDRRAGNFATKEEETAAETDKALERISRRAGEEGAADANSSTLSRCGTGNDNASMTPHFSTIGNKQMIAVIKANTLGGR